MISFLANYKITILVIAGGLLPALVWLWFWLQEDRKHPEPRRMIFYTFIAGGLSVIVAYYLEQYVARGFDTSSLENINLDLGTWTDTSGLATSAFWLFIIWGVIEEVVKFLATWLVAFRSRYFDEPVDAMVYMITAAVGFAAVENSLFLLKTLRLGMTGFDFLINGNLRFIGATLLHVFSSALVGGAVALAYRRPLSRPKRFWLISGSILLAALLHALFNFFIIINGGQYIFRVLVLLWLSVVVLIILFEKIKNIKSPYVQR